MPRNSTSQHHYVAARQMAKSEKVTVDIAKILVKKVEETKKLFVNGETVQWNLNLNLNNNQVFWHIQQVKHWIVQWLKKNWTKNWDTFAQASLITANKANFLKQFLITKCAHEKLRYLCWTAASHSGTTEWIDWYFTKPTNAFTHYEHNITNMGIHDDEISVPLRFDEEDLKRMKFDKQLSYTGIVN